MSSIRAITVDPEATGRLTISQVPAPTPTPSEAVIRLRAISLNLGEVRRVGSAAAGWRPGWDIAGVVEEAAADGSGLKAGTRVVGILDSGAWAELVAVPTNHLAALPESVSFAQAATLPVAGLTALRALARGGLLLEQPVLITGASGGVGHLAIQIARATGARPVGVVRREDRAEVVRQAGASAVVTEQNLEAAQQHGPYQVILESVGGRTFNTVLQMLAPGGTCVLYGTSADPELRFAGRDFYLIGGASLYGFILFYELAHDPPAHDLERLVGMVAAGTLEPQITAEAPWTDIGRMAQRLANREISGKAVLQVG